MNIISNVLQASVHDWKSVQIEKWLGKTFNILKKLHQNCGKIPIIAHRLWTTGGGWAILIWKNMHQSGSHMRLFTKTQTDMYTWGSRWKMMTKVSFYSQHHQSWKLLNLILIRMNIWILFNISLSPSFHFKSSLYGNLLRFPIPTHFN